MKTQPALNYLVPLIVVLAFAAAAFGLFTPRDGSLHTFTTARGETVDLWGQGLYRFDTPIGASGFLAGDIVTLALAIPILLITLGMYRRGSLKGGLLLSGTLAYFLYTYASLGFGAAYNNFFLAYTVIFSASLFGLILILLSFDVQALPTHFGAGLPRKGIGLFLMISSVILSLIWLVLSIIPALLADQAPPEAYYYTTFTTGIIDIGIVAPVLLVAGVLIRRNAPSGYLFASALLIFTCILGANLTAGGIMQVAQSIITLGQAMTFTVPFVILTLFAIGYTFILFRSMTESVR